MDKVDYAALAREVYAFARSGDPLAAPVKEALEVIDEAFETWGYVILPMHVQRQTEWYCMRADQTMSL